MTHTPLGWRLLSSAGEGSGGQAFRPAQAQAVHVRESSTMCSTAALPHRVKAPPSMAGPESGLAPKAASLAAAEWGLSRSNPEASPPVAYSVRKRASSH